MMNNIVQKLTSRKFWVALIGIAIGVAAAFGIDTADYGDIAVKVAGIIGAIASGYAYIKGESAVDAARAGNQIAEADQKGVDEV